MNYFIYLAVNTLKAELLQTKECFKAAPVGINKLNSLTMAQKTGINNIRLWIHSGRKTMIQPLVKSIFQLSGHKNLKSIKNYSKMSIKREMQMSKLLRGYASGSATKTSSQETTNPAAICPSTSQTQQGKALFSGAVIKGGNFSISINTVNQSPKLTLEPESSPVIAKDKAISKWKRLNFRGQWQWVLNRLLNT